MYFAGLIRPESGRPGRRGVWRGKPKRPVGTVSVVVLDVDPEHLLKVTATDDQQPVQALGPHRRDPSLRVRIRPGRWYGRHHHLGTLGAEHVIEAAGEPGIPVAKYKAHPHATRSGGSAPFGGRCWTGCWSSGVGGCDPYWPSMPIIATAITRTAPWGRHDRWPPTPAPARPGWDGPRRLPGRRRRRPGRGEGGDRQDLRIGDRPPWLAAGRLPAPGQRPHWHRHRLVGIRGVREVATCPGPRPTCWGEGGAGRRRPAAGRHRRRRRLPRPAAAAGASELAENRRQQQTWEREALELVRSGLVDDAVAAYRAHDRVVAADSKPAATLALLADWWQAWQDAERDQAPTATARPVDGQAGRRQGPRAAMLAALWVIHHLPCSHQLWRS
jgi:hypothetical protein